MNQTERVRADAERAAERMRADAERMRADDEAAALIVVLAAVSGGRAPEPVPAGSAWGAQGHRSAGAWAAGPGRWWASGLPG